LEILISPMKNALQFLLNEKGILGGWASIAILSTIGSGWISSIATAPEASIYLLWLLVAILGCAFAVVRHADSLAIQLGEPLGTLILTLSVIGMEVSMVSAVMLSGKNNPVLARDTMFAVVMIVLGGLAGVSLMLGAWRHHQQEFNLQGAGAYLSLIVPLAVFALVLPLHTVATPGPTFSHREALILSILCVLLYILFLIIQTVRHRNFFEDATTPEQEEHHSPHGIGASLVLLFSSLLPVVILSKKLAVVLDFGTSQLNLPTALSGVIVALLILAPEGLSAIKSAMKNQLQRSINLLLGSVLATIALTVPAVLTIGLIFHREVHLGLRPQESILICVMLAVSMLTFGSARTNLLQGAVHLLVFFFWLVLVFGA
jgi:Ca2+:H+ antiporter